ncbi:hypothetical protein D1632_09860 [Chryseobacterium nematophagum]|uniref:Uncharacterized protein n=1 Tax=Chryseobacterium nematophagum TaxID=2305228 RepID=A0A3M7LCE5_9FLAO|nr:hypothetical protein [Chryseobacterium nematophagum]RMZ59899.1 hypothetical protein D1632_09860 [Chryseobacterium nematophagum]
MENQVYNWFVKKGNIIIQKDENCVSLQLDYENGDCCLLTNADTDKIIGILISISKQIWESPSYEKIPYTNPLYKISGNEYYWEIENSKLILQYNEMEEGIELKCVGTNKLNIELNCVVEIIQIMEHLSK